MGHIALMACSRAGTYENGFSFNRHSPDDSSRSQTEVPSRMWLEGRGWAMVHLSIYPVIFTRVRMCLVPPHMLSITHLTPSNKCRAYDSPYVPVESTGQSQVFSTTQLPPVEICLHQTYFSKCWSSMLQSLPKEGAAGWYMGVSVQFQGTWWENWQGTLSSIKHCWRNAPHKDVGSNRCCRTTGGTPRVHHLLLQAAEKLDLQSGIRLKERL